MKYVASAASLLEKVGQRFKAALEAALGFTHCTGMGGQRGVACLALEPPISAIRRALCRLHVPTESCRWADQQVGGRILIKVRRSLANLDLTPPTPAHRSPTQSTLGAQIPPSIIFAIGVIPELHNEQNR